MKTVGYFDINDKAFLSYPIFLIRNVFLIRMNVVNVKIAATHAGFGHIQVAMATKLFVLTFDSARDWQSVPVVSWTRA